MAAIDAGTVKKLREATSAGIMDCKSALKETGGDFEAAVKYLREKSKGKIDKLGGRATGEGQVGISISNDGKRAGIIEVNCETDFVARNEGFQALVAVLAQAAQNAPSGGVDEFNAMSLPTGQTVAETVREAVATMGENIQVARAQSLQTNGVFGTYVHLDGKQAAIVAVESDGGGEKIEQLARDMAMQAVAMRPRFLSRDEVPAEVLDAERKFYEKQAAEEGKPEAIQVKIAEGRLNKEFFQTVALLEQAFVKEPKQTIKQVVQATGGGAKPTAFVRYAVGETQTAE
jgi:elongation factor Ts